MPSQEQSMLISFLRSCSPHSLGDFYLSKLNKDSLLRKELNEVIERVIENRAMVELAGLLRAQAGLNLAQNKTRFRKLLEATASGSRNERKNVKGIGRRS